jgi:rubredoxin
MDKIDYFNSLDEAPDQCKYCPETEFYPVEDVEIDGLIYREFKCPNCGYRIRVKLVTIV